MKVLRLTHIEGCNTGNASCVYDATNCPALLEEINEMKYNEVGEEWKINVEEMPKEKFDDLQEFNGW